MKSIRGVYTNPNRHWVGDGFPVRSLFSYNTFGDKISPFLLLDFAGPYQFEPASLPRGVGEHPHRGFETVTVVYDGEVSHRDSAGNGGTIGPGDVQWMTAASGILHEEFHSTEFTRTGGPFRMIQLWVNLPARLKMVPPAYQSISSISIPVVELPDGKGSLRVIAGDFAGTHGPARTFTPINMWDLHLNAEAKLEIDFPEGQTAILVVLSGQITVGTGQGAGEAEFVLLSREGSAISVKAESNAKILVLTGEPIDEPVVGYGPFVMNSETEIREAIRDLQAGNFGQIVGR